MDIDIFSSAWNIFSQSDIFYYLKVTAGFATAILLIANILLLSKRIRSDIRVSLYGTGAPRLKKSKYAPRWERIMKRLDEKSVASGKVALIEADKMLGEILGKLGFLGKNAEEKVGNIKPGQLVGIEDMQKTQALHNRIIEDPTHKTSLEEVQAALYVYERVFRGLEIIE